MRSYFLLFTLLLLRRLHHRVIVIAPDESRNIFASPLRPVLTRRKPSILQQQLDQSGRNRGITARKVPILHSPSSPPLHFGLVLSVHIPHKLQLVPNRAVVLPAISLRQHSRQLHVVQKHHVLVSVRLRSTAPANRT